MMENYLLYFIPLVLIQTVCGNTPDEPGIQFNTPSPVHYDTKELISVICSLTESTPSAADAVLKWFDKKGTEITATSGYPSVMKFQSPGGPVRLLMQLGEAQEDMAGKYKCTATVNEASYERNLDIRIKAALELINCPKEQFGIMGLNSVISCTASLSTYEIFWTKENGLLNDTNKFIKTTTSLTIVDTEESDRGVYRYNVVNMMGSESKIQRITFLVYVAPTIVEPVLTTTAVVGRPATLYCNAKGKPDPTIEWKKEGSTNILQNTERITVTTNADGDTVQGILKFDPVEREDGAFYTCFAKNDASISNDKVNAAEGRGQLVVQIPPTFEKVEDRKGIEGAAANLTCIARGDPVPNVAWVNVQTGDIYKPGTSNNGISATKEVLNQPNNLGVKVTLMFNKLQHSDAGQYKCEAKNAADEAEIIVNLEVEYKPNFQDQGPDVFYNWLGNKEAYLTCTANGNPVPGFTWFKGDREITNGDNYHKKELDTVDPENKHRATSKLLVTYTGTNDDAVFGTYRCRALNLRGFTDITLTMDKAERPGKPSVNVRDEDAKHIEFWLYESKVKGPEVTYFRVVYNIQGGQDDAKELLVEREYRDHIDINRKYTVLPVHDLQPSTTYVFTFYARSPVGEGPGEELIRTTKAISEPEEPVITSAANSPSPTMILVQWTVPSDGGSDILNYRLTWQRVNVKRNQTYEGTKGYEVLSKVNAVTTVDKIKDPSYTLRNLLPGQFYEIKVYARNGEGDSLPGVKVIRTQTDPKYRPDTSRAARSGNLSVTVFGCLVTVAACLKSFM